MPGQRDVCVMKHLRNLVVHVLAWGIGFDKRPWL